jgi:deoxycytidylate deaminase
MATLHDDRDSSRLGQLPAANILVTYQRVILPLSKRGTTRKPQRTARRYAPEIVIAFVAPTGTDRDLVLTTVSRLLDAEQYQSQVVRLSQFLENRRDARLGNAKPSVTDTRRTQSLQDEGNRLCRRARRSDALAFVAASLVREARSGAHRRRRSKKTGLDVSSATAFLIWSLKRPAEADTLRAIYGNRFFLISVFSPEGSRLKRLIQAEADSHGHVAPTTDDEVAARALVERDEKESKQATLGYGQNVSDAYPLADFFVDATSPHQLEQTLERAVEIIFGDPFATPTRTEYGMFLAHAAALKSSELGRQVGAAILSPTGDVVSLGTNEIPKPEGGHYWVGDSTDDREFVLGSDTSDRLKNRLISEILDAIKSVTKSETVGIQRKLEKALETTRIADLIEFGRPVHAEMAALIDAARLGTPVRGSQMLVTTFPCHLCARLIVAAGISRVEYIYPYPKSLGLELFAEQISPSVDNTRIPFIPFLGVAPRRYIAAFQAPRSRKEESGLAVKRYQHTPRLAVEDPQGSWDLSPHIALESASLDVAKSWLPPTVA